MNVYGLRADFLPRATDLRRFDGGILIERQELEGLQKGGLQNEWGTQWGMGVPPVEIEETRVRCPCPICFVFQMFVGFLETGTLSVGRGGLVTATANDHTLDEGLGFGLDAGSESTLMMVIGDNGSGNVSSGFIDAGGGYSWLIDYDADLGSHFGIVATVVPEPSSVSLLILAFGGLLVWKPRLV